MTKKVFFHPFLCGYEDNYDEGVYKLNNKMCYEVHTTQMSLLNLAYDRGYDVYLVDRTNTDILLVKPGGYAGDKVLRRGHNILKLWMAGAFGDKFTPNINEE